MPESIWHVNNGVPIGYKAGKTEGPPPELREPIRYTEDHHLVLLGPNGSGKTMRQVIPAIAELVGWSLLILDVKGSLCAMTEAHRRAAGNTVIKLNPFHVLGIGSDGFNAIQTLDPRLDSFADDALEMAESIIRVETREPHWPRAAQDLLASIIMYVRLVIPGGSFSDVRELLSRDDAGWRRLVLGGRDTDRRQLDLWESQDPSERDPKYNPPVKHRDMLLPGMLVAARFDKWPEMANKVARFGGLTPDNREAHGVLSEVLVQTRWIDSREVARDMMGDPIDFSILKEKPTTVYLMLPPRRLRTHSSWLRLCIACAVQKLMKDTRKPKVPVMIIMDEYYALAEGDGFPQISKNLAMFREYGVKIWTIFQQLAQMEEIYGKGYEVFLGNAGIVQFFAPQDATTSEHVSRLSGQTTRHYVTTSESRNANPAMPQGIQVSHSQSEQFIPMPLLMPQDVRNLSPGYSIIFSETWKGPMRAFTPWPGDVNSLKRIVALNPNN